ncbi:hypothetical protein MMARJ_25500 [Mycobacterium marseillense]|uniref:Secreted protein n=1 Tax=Mycobacterium marseillense TaxID=701042 RepID=A0ABN5ZVJ0_9MYCO|nr:hypothetical protein MMARJ_25500 [Mycobacterium marseillense]
MACAVAGAAMAPSSPATGTAPIAKSDRARPGLRIWVLVICDTPVEQKSRSLLKAGPFRMLARRGVTRGGNTNNAVRATSMFALSSAPRNRRRLVVAASAN